MISRHRIGRHNSPHYTGEETPEPGAETPYATAQEITEKLHDMAAKTGLSVRCIIECHRTMTKMGRTAHVPAGASRTRDIAQHRLAQAILQDSSQSPVSQHRKECLNAAIEMLGADAAPSTAVVLARRISDGAINPGEARQPHLAAKFRSLAAARSRYPPGIWNDLDQCGQEDLPSDAMLARMIKNVANDRSTTMTLPETELLYRLLKENLPDPGH